MRIFTTTIDMIGHIYIFSCSEDHVDQRARTPKTCYEYDNGVDGWRVRTGTPSQVSVTPVEGNRRVYSTGIRRTDF